MKRELLEETGLTVRQFYKPISPLIYNSAGLTDEGVHMAFVEVEGVPDTKLLGNSEDIEVFLMTRAEVTELLNSPDKPKPKFGAKAYLIMSHFVWHGTI